MGAPGVIFCNAFSFWSNNNRTVEPIKLGWLRALLAYRVIWLYCVRRGGADVL